MQSSLRPTIGRHRRHFTGTTNPKPIPSPLAAVLFVTLALTLTRAAYAGSAACVHMLIDAGAKPGITNKRDNSQPLHLAARYGQQAAAVALLERGADVNAINARGNSALHESCANIEGAEVVRTLLRWRTNLEVYNDNENGERLMTPLHVAAESGSISSMRQLLQRGADPQAYVLGSSVNPDGSTFKRKSLDVSKLMARNVMQAVRDAKRRKDDLSTTLASSVGTISSSVGAVKVLPDPDPNPSPMQPDPACSPHLHPLIPNQSADFGLSRSSRKSPKKKKPVGRSQLGGSASVQPADAATEAATPPRRGGGKFQWSSVAHRALDARSRAAQRSPRHNGDGSDDAAATPEQRPGEPQIKLQAVHVALAKGNMLCVAELLEWLWRAKGQAPTAQCPNAPCPMPHANAQCPMFKARCRPMANAQYARWGANRSSPRRSSRSSPSPSFARSG